MKNKLKIDYLSIVGLGYVGLPLALEFGKKYRTVGVDLSLDKIKSYKKKFDPAGEISKDIFNQSKKIIFTHKIITLKYLSFFKIPQFKAWYLLTN